MAATDAPGTDALPHGEESRVLDALVEKGLVSRSQLEEARRVLREQDPTVHAQAHALMDVLILKGYVNAALLADASALPAAPPLVCPRCCIAIPYVASGVVPTKCTGCGADLNEQSSATARDTLSMLLAKEPAPPEVQAIRHDPQRRFGKYLLMERVGTGGVGEVVKAWDTYLGQYVALKRIRPARDGDTHVRDSRTQSLIREARNSIRLRHPGIVSVFDVGRIDREFYISMEFIEGETLADRIARSRQGPQRSPLYENPRLMLRQLREVARAVHHAHSRPVPIIHCDLKPANILIDGSERPHVLDFGLARALTPHADDGDEISGTPHYMAPEQAMGRNSEIDARSDVYSFGAVLYELLTGRPPFVGSLRDVLSRLVSEPPVPPREALGPTSDQIPPHLEELCLRCLQKSPSARPLDMLDIDRVLHEAELAGTRLFSRPDAAPAPPAVLQPAPSRPSTSRRVAPPPVAPPPAPPLQSSIPTVVAPPPPASPSTRRRTAEAAPPQPPPPRARWPIAAVALIAVAAVAVALVLMTRSDPVDRLMPEYERSVAVFDLDRAGELVRTELSRTTDARARERLSTLAEEAQWLARLRAAAIRALGAERRTLDELRTREETLRNVELDGADARVIGVLYGGHRRDVAWSSLEPSQVVSLLRAALPEMAPPERLAIGIYCLRAGRHAEARRFFDGLQGTMLEGPAVRYRTLMEPRKE
jgi:serine/threonine protein kinase